MVKKSKVTKSTAKKAHASKSPCAGEKILNELLTEFYQAYSGIAFNPIMHNYDKNILQKIEDGKKYDNYLLNWYKNIKRELSNHNMEISKHIELYNEYSEAEIYIRLKEKGIKIEKIKETKNSNPDFKCSIKSSFSKENIDFYIELKTIHFVDAEYNIKKTMNNSLLNNIDLEEKRGKKDNNILFSDPLIISPFDDIEIEFLIKQVIEKTICKMEQNFKSSQFKNKLTIPLFNLTLLSPPLTDKDLMPYFTENNGQRFNQRSGILWNLCFIKKGALILGWEEFEGKGNVEGYSNNEGFLVSKEKVYGCLFFNRKMDGESRFYGLYKDSKQDEIYSIIHSITGKINNCDKNSQQYQYIDKN